jgi:hypothetical protein
VSCNSYSARLSICSVWSVEWILGPEWAIVVSGCTGLHCKLFIKLRFCQGVVVHTFNPSTQEAEAGGSLSLRPAWSTEWVTGSLSYTEKPYLNTPPPPPPKKAEALIRTNFLDVQEELAEWPTLLPSYGFSDPQSLCGICQWPVGAHPAFTCPLGLSYHIWTDFLGTCDSQQGYRPMEQSFDEQADLVCERINMSPSHCIERLTVLLKSCCWSVSSFSWDRIRACSRGYVFDAGQLQQSPPSSQLYGFHVVARCGHCWLDPAESTPEAGLIWHQAGYCYTLPQICGMETWPQVW